MKRFVTLSAALFFLIVWLSSCTNSAVAPAPSSEDSVGAVDSLTLQLHKLDSLYNSGNLVHLDIYKIGRIKSISITVQSVDVQDSGLQYINLRKDCGNDYYYSWEDARILPSEIPYLLNAIQTVKQNAKRETDHEERYAYITKDDIRIFSTNSGGNAKWNIALSVDYRKDRSEVSLSEDELDSFVALIKQGEQKIAELGQ